MAFPPEVDLFQLSLKALLDAVAELPDEAFDQPSGCAGWLVRDLATHLVIGTQDVLITLVTPADTEPTANAVSYWEIVGRPNGEDPLDALVPRLAAAYGEPRWLKFHLDDVGSAAGRAAGLADPAAIVSTREKVLSSGDFLSAYVLEWTLHHLDLTAHLPGAPLPPADCLATARTIVEQVAGFSLPASLSDVDALLLSTGRRRPTEADQVTLGDLGTSLPISLG